MNTNSALKLAPQVPSIEQSRAEIHALFDADSHGGSLWNNLPESDKKMFCLVAGVTITDLKKPLNKVNQFDRVKLFMAIKSLSETVMKFDAVSLQEFK